MAEVFISYSRKDHKWLERLKKYLKPLLQEHIWYDTEISPGEDWREAIETSLEKSQIAILLISPDYLASKWVVEAELPLILKKSQAGKLKVLPLIISPTLISPSYLQTYQAVNSPSEPLSELSESKQEEVFYKLSQAIIDSLPNRVTAEVKVVDQSEDRYSAALNTAIKNIGGNVSSINILGDRNIFFEAEERLAQKNKIKSTKGGNND